MIRLIKYLVGAFTICALLSATEANSKNFVFAYLMAEDDPRYLTKRRYTGLTLRQQYPSISGAKVAIRESRILSRSLGITFKLIEKSLRVDGDYISIIKSLINNGVKVFLLDIPAQTLRAITKEFKKEPVLLFNIRNRDNDLRNKNCSLNLYHSVPSYRMLTDALAQYLVKRGWKNVLLLRGPEKNDHAYADAFVSSARRLRIDIVDDRNFTLSNDPRERSKSNVSLLTGGIDYDVVFVADSQGEFGRYVAYRTYLPRPIVGDEGLTPVAWHWTWERHGAPQLNQRFARIEKNRHMRSEDWAAWIGIKSVISAIRKTLSQDINVIRQFLIDDGTTIDTYKGNPSSYRAWNNQLRQPILLHTHNAVIARAPIDGFLHQINNLDTMGYDHGEAKCQITN